MIQVSYLNKLIIVIFRPILLSFLSKFMSFIWVSIFYSESLTLFSFLYHSQQGAWGVVNDRQSEDPPGTFDGVPGYVIARIDEVRLYSTEWHNTSLSCMTRHFRLQVSWSSSSKISLITISFYLTFMTSFLSPSPFYFTTCSAPKILVISSTPLWAF